MKNHEVASELIKIAKTLSGRSIAITNNSDKIEKSALKLTKLCKNFENKHLEKQPTSADIKRLDSIEKFLNEKITKEIDKLLNNIKEIKKI